MQKRGELTSSQITTLILTIAGFVIALIFLLVFLDTDSLEQRELCKLSVLTRATAPEALQRLAPLKCTTEKICLSESGGKDCPQFLGVKEKEIQTIKVSSEENLEKAVADSMLDCWNMMGEGKLDVFGGGTNYGIWSLLDTKNLFTKETVCVICSRLAIDSKLQKSEKIRLAEVDVNSYMETHQAPHSDKTYTNLFTDQQIRSYPREFRDSLTGDGKNVVPTDEIAILFLQINTEDTPIEAGTSTGIKTGAFMLTASAGLSPLGKILTFDKTVLAAGFTAATTGGIAAFQTWRSRNLAAGYCGELTSINKGGARVPNEKEARKGCSVVIPINYKDVQSINKFCSIIEGQP